MLSRLRREINQWFSKARFFQQLKVGLVYFTPQFLFSILSLKFSLQAFKLQLLLLSVTASYFYQQLFPFYYDQRQNYQLNLFFSLVLEVLSQIFVLLQSLEQLALIRHLTSRKLQRQHPSLIVLATLYLPQGWIPFLWVQATLTSLQPDLPEKKRHLLVVFLFQRADSLERKPVARVKLRKEARKTWASKKLLTSLLLSASFIF